MRRLACKVGRQNKVEGRQAPAQPEKKLGCQNGIDIFQKPISYLRRSKVIPFLRFFSVASVVATVFFFAWLFLPPGAILIGPVTLRKEDVVRLLPLALVFILDPRLLVVRWHWVDIPVFVYCLCPLLCGVANHLDWQDSLWEMVKEFEYWFVPYLLGRAVFFDFPSQRRLAICLIIAAVCLVPPTVFEIVHGPKWTAWLTGRELVGQERGALRGSTFKPSVFLSSGFVLTMFYVLATLTALGLAWDGFIWRSRWLTPHPNPLPGRPGRGDNGGVWTDAGGAGRGDNGFPLMSLYAIAFVFAVVVVACKSLGSIVLLGVGLAVMVACRCTPVRYWLIPLVLIAPMYIGLRISGLATTDRVDAVAKQFVSAERAGSLAYRLRAEDIVFQRMQGHWWLGWGDYGLWQQDANVMALDGFWLFALTRTGLVSVIAWLAMVTIPIFVFACSRRRQREKHMDQIGLVFALFLALSLVDSMFNYFGDAPQMLLLGGLAGIGIQMVDG